LLTPAAADASPPPSPLSPTPLAAWPDPWRLAAAAACFEVPPHHLQCHPHCCCCCCCCCCYFQLRCPHCHRCCCCCCCSCRQPPPLPAPPHRRYHLCTAALTWRPLAPAQATQRCGLSQSTGWGLHAASRLRKHSRKTFSCAAVQHAALDPLTPS